MAGKKDQAIGKRTTGGEEAELKGTRKNIRMG
jgi:hypothetical protein